MALKNVATVGLTLAGGVTLTPSQGHLRVNGRLALRDMDLTLPHLGPHPPNPVPSTSGGIFINGRRILRQGDIAMCGHPLVIGDPIVYSG